ncbi:MAG: hypothetical protein WCR27_05945 [Eubacteriales bacterium]
MPNGSYDSFNNLIDIEEAYKCFVGDPYLGEIVKKWGKCTLVRGENYYFELCKSIMSQQISTKVAQKMTERLSDLFDGKVTPEKVYKVDFDELRSIGLSARKTETLIQLAQSCIEKKINLELVDRMTDRNIGDYLVKVKGIGPWTVTMFLIFAMNRSRVIPIGDFGIRKAVQNVYSLDEMPSPEKVGSYFSSWAPHESVASWYLWRSLENS